MQLIRRLGLPLEACQFQSHEYAQPFSPRFVLFAYAFILAARCDPALGHNSNTEWTVRNLALSDGMLLKMIIVWPHQ